MKRLQAVQNTAARIISGTRKYDSITPVLRALHWLPVHQRVIFKTFVLVFKALNNLAPCYIQELLCPYVPSRSLRSCDQNYLKTTFTRSNTVQSRAFSVAAPRLWNNLPNNIRTAPSLNVFKTKLKTYLFNEFFN